MQDKKSKSARKREHLALQILGEQLIGLPEIQLRDMSLDESLMDAIIAAVPALRTWINTPPPPPPQG